MTKERIIEKDAVEIINNHIGGFHICYLSDPIHLDYASDNFCEMIGYTAEEMTRLFNKLYTGMVHPNDVDKYVDFVYRLAAKEQSMSIEYRMIRKNGDIIKVFDTMTSKRDGNGTMWGMSVVTVLEENYKGHVDSDALHEVVPFGTVRFEASNERLTILSMNPEMKFLLDITNNVADEMEYLNNDMINIFPQNRRSDFNGYLREAGASGETINFEISILTAKGRELGVMGWVNKVNCADNEKSLNEYIAAFVDATPRIHKEVQERANQLIMTVFSVYDVVFEINLTEKTVKCVKDKEGNIEEELKGLRIYIADAFDFIVNNVIVEEDRRTMYSFFMTAMEEYQQSNNKLEKEMEFRTNLRGNEKTFNGKILFFDSVLAYLCCSDISEKKKVELLEIENKRLRKENEIVKGIINNTKNNLMEIEIKKDNIKPVSVSKSVLEFLGMDESEYKELSKNGVGIQDFFSKSSLSYEQAKKLLIDGETDYTLGDEGNKRRAMVVDTSIDKSNDSKIYTVQYDLKDDDSRLSEAIVLKQNTVNEMKEHIYIRTFGYFDIFIDDKPIYFRSRKAKELLAIIVDRKGGYVSAGEAISYMWENDTKNSVSLARHRKVAMRLRDTLRQHGVEDIIVTSDGKRRINKKLIRCDLYDYLSGDARYENLFNGLYMVNYSWGEFTLAELESRKNAIGREIEIDEP